MRWVEGRRLHYLDEEEFKATLAGFASTGASSVVLTNTAVSTQNDQAEHWFQRYFGGGMATLWRTEEQHVESMAVHGYKLVDADGSAPSYDKREGRSVQGPEAKQPDYLFSLDAA